MIEAVQALPAHVLSPVLDDALPTILPDSPETVEKDFGILFIDQNNEFAY